MTRSAAGSIATIDQFIAQVGQVKTANEKVADGSAPLSEPGSIGGETSHPVKKVDDRLEKAKEGDRSAENSKDVKKDQGAPSVENAAEASTKNAAAKSIFGVAAGFAKKAEGGAVSTPGSAADDHISTTTKVAPTGEDPSSETNSAKAGKEDKEQGGVGGTSHPASTENDQLDGHKYANDSLEKLAADMRASGNNLLAALHGVYQNSGVQAPQQTKTAAAHTPAPQQGTIDPRLAYMAGSELASLMSGTMDKRAADKLVQDTLTEVVKQAADDADLFITYATDFLKRAEGEDEGAADPTAGGGGEKAAAPGGGGAPPGGGGGGGGEEEAMMAALGGGAGAGDPAAGGGGDPMGGMGGGGGGPDEEAAKLGLILEQLGITPEELEQAMAEQGMGGMGGGMGGGMETQANAGGGKRNLANSTIKQAEVASYIREIVSRSRAKR